MADPVRIIGSYISPYVRKVLVCLHTKGVPYEIDPIIPFLGDDRFSQLSPLRRIPVYTDDRVTLADSSVICQYLEDRHPEPAFYPRDVADRARARATMSDGKSAGSGWQSSRYWQITEESVRVMRSSVYTGMRRRGLNRENRSSPMNGMIGSISYARPFKSRQTSTLRT